jgi:polar amino acid transport system substrate-binding protein
MAMTITLFSGCGSSSTNTSVQKIDSLKRVKSAGKITVGIDDSYPPMEFRDEKNNLLGFDIDLGEEIGKKLGVKVEYIPTDWNGILLALKSSKFDIILSSLSMTEERKKEIDFAGPYIEGGQIIAVNKTNNEIKSSVDLKGKVIGAQLGSTGEQAAAKIEGTKEVKKYDKATEAFHDLQIGRIEAVIVDGQVGGYYNKKDGDAFKILDEKLTKEPEGIGLKKEDKELKEAIQKALDELKADGTLSKLSLKWFGYDIYKK